MVFGCCVVTLASHVSLPPSPIFPYLLGFTYFCQAVRLTWITLISCITLLCGICLYYARFWQPEKDDKGTSGFTPQTDELVRKQTSKERRRKLIRRTAVAGLVLIPLLSLTGFSYWQHLQSQPSKDILILVADFDGPDPQKYGVSEMIRENLRSATQPYDDVKVKPWDG